MFTVFFYTTEGCHLCEQAEALITAERRHPALRPAWQLVAVEISESEALIQRFGTRIPVLACTDRNGEELQLGWPFDREQIRSFIQKGFDYA